MDEYDTKIDGVPMLKICRVINLALVLGLIYNKK